MTRNQSWTSERPDRLLEAADPVERPALTTTGVEGALDELGALIATRSATARPARKRLTRRTPAILVVAAVLAGSAAVAAGTVLTAHTGLFPTKAEEAMGGPGEALRPAAPDFHRVALQVASDIPYPAGYGSWRDFLISDEIRFAGDGVESTGALHGWFAASAFCAWVHVWRQARMGGDSAAARHAARVISQAPSWTAVTDEDPHPDPSVPADMGSTYSLFGWMLPYRDAVVAGDRGRVERLLVSGYGDKCWTSDPAWRAQLEAHRWRVSRSELERRYARFLASERP
jgi:hypothetical protein